MKQIKSQRIVLLFALCSVLLLSACTANTSGLDENGLSPHLAVDIILPDDLSVGKEASFQLHVQQGGEPIEADQATFEFWREDDPAHRITIDGETTEAGVYTAVHNLGEAGIYNVQCTVTAGSMEAMPIRRFAIGEEAVLQLAAMQQPTDGMTQMGGSAGEHQH